MSKVKITMTVVLELTPEQAKAVASSPDSVVDTARLQDAKVEVKIAAANGRPQIES